MVCAEVVGVKVHRASQVNKDDQVHVVQQVELDDNAVLLVSAVRSVQLEISVHRVHQAGQVNLAKKVHQAQQESKVIKVSILCTLIG